MGLCLTLPANDKTRTCAHCVTVCYVCTKQHQHSKKKQPPLPTHFLCGICTGCHRYRKSPPSTSTSTTVSSMISTRASFAGKQKVKKVGSRWFFSKAAAQQAIFKTCSQKDLHYLTYQTATLDWPSLQRWHRKAWLHSLWHQARASLPSQCQKSLLHPLFLILIPCVPSSSFVWLINTWTRFHVPLLSWASIQGR